MVSAIRVPSDEMLAELRKTILRGGLHPGEHLSQSSLAERYAVSKVPVREALKQLETEGLVEHDRNRGYFVARRTASEARQLYRIRRFLESELLRTAEWPEDEVLARLDLLLAILQEPPQPGERDAWFEALEEMRFRIFDLSPDKYVLREARRLWALTDRFRSLLPPDKAGTGEAAIIDAFRARDREALLAAYHADRDRIEKLLQDALEDMPMMGQSA